MTPVQSPVPVEVALVMFFVIGALHCAPQIEIAVLLGTRIADRIPMSRGKRAFPGGSRFESHARRPNFFRDSGRSWSCITQRRKPPMGRCIPVTGCLASRRDITNAMT